MKKNKDYVQYFKAWNAAFNYKRFNLDMNNDIESECVPNILFYEFECVPNILFYLRLMELKRKYQINIYTQFKKMV